MTQWPAFRTVLGGDGAIQRWDGGLAMGVTFVIMAILSWTIGLFTDPEVAGILGIAIFLSPVTLPLFLALGVWGLRKGYGGWGIALLAGAGLSVVPIVVISVMEPEESLFDLLGDLIGFACAGMVLTGVMWITLYLRRPAAFLGPRPWETPEN